MKYWWHLTLKGGEIVAVTPDEAAEAMKAKEAGKPVLIERLRRQIDAWQVIDTEESSRVLGQNDTLGLGTGTLAERPQRGTHGVKAQLVKRFVKDRDYKRDFAGHPGYWPLRSDEARGGVFVVHARPVFASGLPEGLEELEDWEEKIMEKKLAGTPGWWNA